MEIRPMTQAEQKYTFKQSMQIESQTCQVGYLRGDFGINGREFHTSWHDTDSRRNTDEFATEFDEVIHALRSEECGLFASRYDMKRYVAEHSDSAFGDSHRTAYGFRVDTEKHVYLLWCNPSPSDYNFTAIAMKSRGLTAISKRRRRESASRTPITEKSSVFPTAATL